MGLMQVWYRLTMWMAYLIVELTPTFPIKARMADIMVTICSGEFDKPCRGDILILP